jgi:hypothetical protein
MENRRLLGTEKITLLDGTEREIKVYGMGFVEKLNLIKKHTKTSYIKGFSYKEVDEISIMQEVLEKCIVGCDVNELDYNAQDIYDKYFKKKEDDKDEEKKEITSTTSPLDIK